MIETIAVEHVTLATDRAFEEVVAAFEASRRTSTCRCGSQKLDAKLLALAETVTGATA